MENNMHRVASAHELPEGEMKAFKIGDDEILLVNHNNQIYATGAHCPHYGAPLEKGIFYEDRIICPWHHTCYQASTGKLLEPPAFDDLPVYPTTIKEGEIYVDLPGMIERSQVPEMSKHNPLRDTRMYVILGAGAAAKLAAQTLREDGFEGEILMITREEDYPYDRPNLSKDYLQGEAPEEWIPLRPEDFYEKYDIQVATNKLVTDVDIAEKMVTFGDAQRLRYDKLLIATGGLPRRMDVPGNTLENVFTLRSYRDARQIIERAKASRRALIVGSSFIGMETAYSLSKRLEVTVVSKDETPFEKTLGKEIGELFRRQHEKGGITFRMGETIGEFIGEEKLREVRLQSGETIPADIALIGVGVRPSTDFIKGLEIQSDGSLLTNEYLECARDVYAAGDIAMFPYRYAGHPIRIEHWRTAQQLGRIAGHNMAGKRMTYDSVPFFWTRQAGMSLQYIGHAPAWDEIIYDGEVASMEYLAFFVKDSRIRAVAGSKRPKDMLVLHELMRLGRIPEVETIRNQKIDYVEYLHRLAPKEDNTF